MGDLSPAAQLIEFVLACILVVGIGLFFVFYCTDLGKREPGAETGDEGPGSPPSGGDGSSGKGTSKPRLPLEDDDRHDNND